MNGPYFAGDKFSTHPKYKPLVCPDPENCTELHNEADPVTGEEHHYDCICGWCRHVSWTLKHG